MASHSNLWDLNIRSLWPESAALEPCPNAGRGGDDCTCDIDVTTCRPKQWRMVQRQYEQEQAYLASTLRILPFFNRAVQERLREQQQQRQREGQPIARSSRFSAPSPVAVDNNVAIGLASQRRKDSTDKGEKPVVATAALPSRPNHGQWLANYGKRVDPHYHSRENEHLGHAHRHGKVNNKREEAGRGEEEEKKEAHHPATPFKPRDNNNNNHKTTLTRKPWTILQKKLRQNYHLTGRRHALLGEPFPTPASTPNVSGTTTTTSSEIQQMIEVVIYHNRCKTAVEFSC